MKLQLTWSVLAVSIERTFLLAPGASEPLRPMSSIASGGEKARLMLAMKMAPAMDNAERDIRNTESPTISVFDEVDTQAPADRWHQNRRRPEKARRRWLSTSLMCHPSLKSPHSVKLMSAFAKKKTIKTVDKPSPLDAIETEIRLEEIADMLGIGSEQGLENAKRLLQDATN